MIESSQWVQRYRAGRQIKRPKKCGSDCVALLSLGNKQKAYTPKLRGGKLHLETYCFLVLNKFKFV